MVQTSHYDTVAFDVRDNAAMLFFADTAESGDINNYLLLMRAGESGLGGALCLEVNEEQVSGEDVIREAKLTANVLTLCLQPSAAARFGGEELVLSFDDTDANRAGIEAGALRVLGDKLTGGNS